MAHEASRADGLKPFSELCVPDPRNPMFSRIREPTQDSGPETLRDVYNDIERIRLDESVPEKVRIHFDTARNLSVYSWFVYRFGPVARLHAYQSVELALKTRLEEQGAGLKRLLERAIEKNLIKDEGFSACRQVREARIKAAKDMEPIIGKAPRDVPSYREGDFVRSLVNSLPAVRNELAHGSTFLDAWRGGALRLCADLINQLFNGLDPDEK